MRFAAALSDIRTQPRPAPSTRTDMLKEAQAEVLTYGQILKSTGTPDPRKKAKSRTYFTTSLRQITSN